MLRSMLAPLAPEARTALGFAALLPPDLVPWKWVQELATRHHPELGQKRPGYPDPWVTLRRTPEGLRFLTGSAESEFARMHRLVGAHLRVDLAPDLDAELRAHVAARCDAIYQSEAPPAGWELDGLLEAVPHLMAARSERTIAHEGMFLSDKVRAYHTLSAAHALLLVTGEHLERLTSSDPGSAEKQRDIGVSHYKLFQLAVQEENTPAAVAHLRAFVAVWGRLAAEGRLPSPNDQNILRSLRQQLEAFDAAP